MNFSRRCLPIVIQQNIPKYFKINKPAFDNKGLWQVISMDDRFMSKIELEHKTPE